MFHSSSSYRLVYLPFRSKKYYPNWKDPYNLDDYQTITRSKPSSCEMWDLEWKKSKLPKELKSFDVSRLPTHLKARWNPSSQFFAEKSLREKSKDYKRKLFGTYGLKSGIDPADLFDDHSTIHFDSSKDQAIESSVQEALREKAERDLEMDKQNALLMSKIKSNLAKMPQLIEKFKSNQAKQHEVAELQRTKERVVMEEARDRYGYYLNPKDDKFRKLKSEIEEAQKLERKENKKTQKNKEQTS